MSYYRRVLERALTDTRQATPKTPSEAIRWVIGLVVASVLVYALMGAGPALDNARLVGIGLIGALVTIGLFFLWNLLTAPGKLSADDAAALRSAQIQRDRLTSVRFRLVPRARSEIGQISASASLWVENVDEGEARNCRGRLIGLTYPGGPRRATLDVPLSWVHPDHPDDPTRKTFYRGAELEIAVQGTPNYMIPAGATRRTIVDPRMIKIARDADNILGIEIAPEGAVPTVGWFRLRWWSFVQIKQDDGSVVHYETRGDQIEFEDADPQSMSSAISSQVQT